MCTFFLSLFALAAHKDVMVANVWDSTREGGGWLPCFSRPFNDWEMEEVERFLKVLQNKKTLLAQQASFLSKRLKAGVSL